MGEALGGGVSGGGGEEDWEHEALAGVPLQVGIPVLLEVPVGHRDTGQSLSSSFRTHQQ